uniref:Uncharacterized protein n=1 Tax=Kalanchoe fedtschenkoi TaxID=63787 RepID=A0A7N0U5F8_KALFE
MFFFVYIRSYEAMISGRLMEREWCVFLVTRFWKHGTGGRPNRTTADGFWKPAGSDRRSGSSGWGRRSCFTKGVRFAAVRRIGS